MEKVFQNDKFVPECPGNVVDSNRISSVNQGILNTTEIIIGTAGRIQYTRGISSVLQGCLLLTRNKNNSY